MFFVRISFSRTLNYDNLFIVLMRTEAKEKDFEHIFGLHPYIGLDSKKDVVYNEEYSFLGDFSVLSSKFRPARCS